VSNMSMKRRHFSSPCEPDTERPRRRDELWGAIGERVQEIVAETACAFFDSEDFVTPELVQVPWLPYDPDVLVGVEGSYQLCPVLHAVDYLAHLHPRRLYVMALLCKSFAAAAKGQLRRFKAGGQFHTLVRQGTKVTLWEHQLISWKTRVMSECRRAAADLIALTSDVEETVRVAATDALVDCGLAMRRLLWGEAPEIQCREDGSFTVQDLLMNTDIAPRVRDLVASCLVQYFAATFVASVLCAVPRVGRGKSRRFVLLYRSTAVLQGKGNEPAELLRLHRARLACGTRWGTPQGQIGAGTELAEAVCALPKDCRNDVRERFWDIHHACGDEYRAAMRRLDVSA
jgi:hypothetical protein